MSSKKKPAAAAPEVAEPEIHEPEAPVEQAEAPEAVEPVAEVADEAPEQAEVEAPAEPEIDPELLKINAAERPMRHPDGEASCDLYKSDKHGHVLVPASEVPGMLEHGFVLVDDA